MGRTALAFTALSAGMLAIGCEQNEEIAHYRVPKQRDLDLPSGNGGEATSVDPDEASDRMLAAVIPRGERSWFFKMTGPKDAVTAEAERFNRLIRSVRFENENEPTWTLPEGWRQRPASGMRFATLVIETPNETLELSVTPLPTASGSSEQFLLSNVNRWRGQMGLSAIPQSRIFAETPSQRVEQIELDETTATIVELLGEQSEGSMGRAPFLSGAGRGPFERPETPPLQGRPQQSEGPSLEFEVPGGWISGQTSALRKAAFEVNEGGQHAEITVIDLPAAAGELLPNVNRWRRQLALPPVSAQELQSHVEEISLGGLRGDYVQILGPENDSSRRMILAAVAVHEDRAWFVTLKGDASLARREQPRFEQFVKSIRFASTNGAGNGH